MKLVTDGLFNRQLFRLCRSRILRCFTTAGYRRCVRLVDNPAVSLLSNKLVWLVRNVPTVLGGSPLKCMVTDLGRNIRSIVRRNIIELVYVAKSVVTTFRFLGKNVGKVPLRLRCCVTNVAL